MTHSLRSLSYRWMLLLCGLLLLSNHTFASVYRGANCSDCHVAASGVVSISGTSLLSVSPRLDGGNTGNLHVFTAKPGDVVTVTLNSNPLGVSGDSFAFAVTTKPSLISGTPPGIKTSVSNHFSFSGASGWTTQLVSGTTYFTQGPLSSTGNTQSKTFQITVGSSTPVDVYSLTFRSSGLDSNSGNHWTQSQEFLINVVSTAPTAATSAASSITSQGATLNGTVNPNGLATNAYFQYGTTTGYGLVSGTQSAGSGSSSVALNSSITGLNASTTYHYRMVAVNTSGTSLGADQSFTTSAIPPTVTTGAATAVTYNSATLSGTINPNGTAATVSFNYGTTASYGLTTSGQNSGAGSSDVAMNAAVTGLSPATTYHFQIVAVTTSGTTRGTDQTFTTQNGPPVVVTGTASSISSGGSTLNGTVNPGGSATTAYFVYGLTTNYGTTTDQTQSAGSGSTAQPFSSAITGLSASTTYHYALVAVNATGTTQGADQNFTTLPPPPVVITGTASPVTSGSALLNGSTITNGLPGTAYYVFGTGTNYGSSTSTQSVSGTNSSVGVSAWITGLNASTTYHYQLVVITASGTRFGGDLTFITPSGPPVATTGAVTSVADVSATLNGTVNPNGGSTSAFFQYGTTTAYGSTTSNQDMGSGFGAQPVNAAISGLAPNTTYHFRVVAASTSGTIQGADQTFTTTASGNANLVSLALSAGQLSPGFSAGQTAYNASVANSVTKLTVTPVKADPGALIALRINGAASFVTVTSGKPSGALALNVGSNLIEVKLAAPNGATKSYTVTVVRVALPATGSAAVSQATATVAGTVDGHATTFAFQYGLTTAYGATTPAQLISSGSLSVVVSSTISSLVPASLYHYRLVSTTGGATDLGADKTFVTSRSYPAPGVAAQGDTAPQIAGPVTFLSFGNPAINDGDVNNSNDPAHWTFQALVTGTGITPKNNSGIWVYSGTSTALIARTGDAAPGGGVFATLTDPVFNNHDQVAFIGTLTGTGYTKSNNTGIWDNTTGSLQLVAQTQGQALDASGVKAASFAQLVLPDQGGSVFLANLVTGVGGVTAANNQGIWAENNGQLKALVRKGDVLAGGTVSALSIFAPQVGVAGQTRNFNSSGDVSFRVTFTKGAQANYVLTSGTLLSQVAASGSAAPSIYGGPSQYTLLGNPALNDGGNTAFQALISGTAKAAVKYPAILAETGTANPLSIVALTGTYAPDANGVTGAAGVFAALGDPVFNNHDQLAFIGKLKVTGAITGASSQGIWENTSGTLALVAQAQSQAPDCAAGTTFSLFTQLVLPDRGGVVFVATLAGKAGVNAANNQGLFAVDTNGNLHLVARKGDVILINGVAKVVNSLVIFNSSVGTAGQTRSFNHSGDLIYKVTFTDKTQAIRKILFP